MFAIVSEELHQDGNTHLHAYIKTRHAIGHVKSTFFDLEGHHPHLETVRSVKSWIEYVNKEGNWCEYGQNPITQQRLTTKERNEKIIKDGIVKCIVDGTVSIQNAQRTIAGIQEMKMLTNGPWNPPTVYWFHGKTGSGKSRRAIEICEEDVWMSGENLKLFDGYRGQRTVIFDDLRTNFCTMNFLLRLLDRYKLFVPIKAGFADWRPELIIITCPVPPRQLFVNRETGGEWDNVDQVVRRVDEMRDFDEQQYGSLPEDGLVVQQEREGAERTEVLENAP